MADPKEHGSDDRLVGDRLQPSLLDRLTDDEPLKQTEPQDAAAMTRVRLRRAVLRDLAWLFNAANNENEIDFDGHPHARKSTINFGVDAFSGKKLTEVEFADIQQSLRAAILAFEPRLLPDTVEVRTVATEDLLSLHNSLAFEVRAKLWSMPYPLEFLLRSTLDFESGEVVVKEQSATPG